MSVDWRRLSRDARLHTKRDGVVVELPPERSQRVHVAADSDGRGFSLTSRVAAPRIVQNLMPGLVERIRAQNRLSELVGYRIDRGIGSSASAACLLQGWTRRNGRSTSEPSPPPAIASSSSSPVATLPE